jgi:hypothetical protein
MSSVDVHIQKLRLRLRGVSVQDARTIADAIGPAIASRLAEQPTSSVSPRGVRYTIDAGSIPAAGAATRDVASIAAERVVNAIVSNTGRTAS